MVYLTDKFIYKIEIYQIWKDRVSFIKEEYCSSSKPIGKLKNKLKKKEYILQRFIDLIAAPKEYLINNGYERKY